MTDTPSGHGASACRHTHDGTGNTVELPLHNMELKSLAHVMVIKYSLEHQLNNTGRNRHALYHFYNTNNINGPVVSISPDIYYANSTLKSKFAPNNVKLARITALSGGNIKKAATIIKRSVRDRYKNIKLKQGKNRINYKKLTNNNIRIKNTHWYQFKHYANLERILGSNRTRNVYSHEQRRPSQLTLNENIIPKYNYLYRVFTRGILFPPNPRMTNQQLLRLSRNMQRANQNQYSRTRYGNANAQIRSIEQNINRLTRAAKARTRTTTVSHYVPPHRRSSASKK